MIIFGAKILEIAEIVGKQPHWMLFWMSERIEEIIPSSYSQYLIIEDPY